MDRPREGATQHTTRLTFADWLAEQMSHERDVTSMELAGELGLLDGDVANWLSGRTTPTPSECRLVAEHFGLAEPEVIQLCGDPSGQG